MQHPTRYIVSGLYVRVPWESGLAWSPLAPVSYQMINKSHADDSVRALRLVANGIVVSVGSAIGGFNRLSNGILANV